MNQEISVRITGEAGQGIISAGLTLCRMYKDSGRHVFAIQDYMSRIRGGNNFFQVRAAAQPVFSPREKADLIVALDKEAVAVNKAALAPGGTLVLDAAAFGV